MGRHCEPKLFSAARRSVRLNQLQLARETVQRLENNNNENICTNKLKQSRKNPQERQCFAETNVLERH